MSIIKENIFQVGAVDPALRVFDIIMTANHGTSYNSYLVKGSEKTALIETCHDKLFDQYVENISQYCDPKEIDVIVLNHNEPDHTGALARLLDVVGDATVYTSKVGATYIKEITNRKDMKIVGVADGDTLDLGGKTLKFISAPFLHWPDSMFTYIEEDKVVCTCDFLGGHYCEPYVFDHKILDKDAYYSEFETYYAAIFGPFKPYVLAGLEKLEKLEFDVVLPSHGPVLTKQNGGELDNSIQKYKEWSTPVKNEQKIVPVFYTSAYGNTEKMAQAIVKGVLNKLPDAQVVAYDIIKHDMSVLAGLINSCDGFAVGTPTINRDAVEPVWQLLHSIDPINCMKKPFFVFGSFGWSGEGIVNANARLVSLKCQPVHDGYKVKFTPSDDNMAEVTELGEVLAGAIK